MRGWPPQTSKFDAALHNLLSFQTGTMWASRFVGGGQGLGCRLDTSLGALGSAYEL